MGFLKLRKPMIRSRIVSDDDGAAAAGVQPASHAGRVGSTTTEKWSPSGSRRRSSTAAGQDKTSAAGF